MDKRRNILKKQMTANTLVELLLTMIISGIIFLLVLDGADIIKRFGHMVNNRVAVTQTSLYSHQFMEYLVENADSIIRKDDKLLFYRENMISDSVTILDSGFVLNSRRLTDTLFAGYIDYRTSSLPSLSDRIDSLFINYVVNTIDTLRLEYTSPHNGYAYLNSADGHEDFR